MGVCTKGFIATPCKDFWVVLRTTQTALLNYTRKNVLPGMSPLEALRKRRIDTTVSDSVSRMVQFQFEDNSGDRRLMSLHFDCDCDEKDQYEGPKLIFSLGAFGEAETIILAVGHALSNQLNGDFHYCSSDCVDDWKVFPFASLT